MMDYSMHMLARTEYRRLHNEPHFLQQRVYEPNAIQRFFSWMSDSLGQTGARLRAQAESPQAAPSMATTEH